MLYLGNTFIDAYLEDYLLEGTNGSSDKLTMEIIDVDKFVKVNDCKPITDPVFFNGPTPSPEGLLSNEIFGITKAERSGIYAYIDLGGTFLNPLIYKALTRLNSKIADIVMGTDTFNINDSGDIVQDPNGHTGIDWLYKNFNKIKFKETESKSRASKIKFIELEKNKMWINKYIVIPAYYRDVDTKQASIGVGEINKLYSALIIASKSLKETAEYGLSLSDAVKGRIQTTLQQIYDWFGAGTTIGGQDTGGNLPGKTGLVKKGIMYKTVDYSVRMVMSAPELEVEDLEDLMVDMDHAAEPLAAAICNFKPFIIFWLRRFFENQFAGTMEYTIKTANGETLQVPIEDYQIMFSDVELDKEIERFIHGYSNRFRPVPIPIDKVAYTNLVKQKKLSPMKNLWMVLSGKMVDPSDIHNIDTSSISDNYSVVTRPLTWCDLFYMAACEVTEDKMVLITRFPIDSYLNQFPSRINIKSTVETIPMIINDKLYKWYPKIGKDDIGINTSPLFSDTLSISNGLIDAMGMDYDGDTTIVKPVYTIEANQECKEKADSKVQMVGMDGKSPRGVSKENIMTLYSLTVHPDDSIKFIDPIF